MSLVRISGRNPRGRVTRVAAPLILVISSVVAALYLGQRASPSGTAPVNAMSIQDAAVPAASAYRYERLAGPARTVVRDRAGVVVAVFTDGARTVAVTGPSRTFREPRMTRATVTTDVWARILGQEWRAGEEQASWFRPWLDTAMGDRSPDALAVAMEYVDGAPSATDGRNVRFRGDATSGRSTRDGPAADFYEYLGTAWTFPDGVRRKPAAGTYGAVDCSGFLRLVYGYRLGYPLLSSNARGVGLPRGARTMYELGPGVPVIPDQGGQAHQYTLLQPGDLVFFGLDTNPGQQVDFVGMYLGMDSDRHHRFIASRSMADGPTFGDFGGASIVDGGGYFSQRFRAAKRI